MLPPEYEIFSDTPNEIIFNLKRILSYIKENRGVTTKEFENLGYDYIDCWHILTILKVDNVMREGQGSNRWREDSKGLGKVWELTDYGLWLESHAEPHYDIKLKIRPRTALPNEVLEDVEKIIFKTEAVIEKMVNKETSAGEGI